MAAKKARREPAEDAGETLDEGERNVAETIESARRTLMDAVPKSAKALAEEAETGSVPHIKLLLQLVGLDEGKLVSDEVKPRERTLEEIFMERWNSEP